MAESVVTKCHTLGLSHAKQLQSHLIATGQFRFPICQSRSYLLELYALPLSRLPFAIHTFRRIPSPSVNDWNAILRGLAASPSPRNAFSWYRSMARAPRNPDALTCSFVLKALARVVAVSESAQLHTHVLRRGFAADAPLATTLVDCYAKFGDLVGARKVFDEMCHRDIASWNALITGFAQGSKPGEALDLYKSIEGEGFRPNAVSVLGALSACSQLGAFKEGEKVHKYVRDEGLDMNVRVCNSVIDMYAKCALLDKAYSVFEGMRCGRSIVTWNTMIMAFATDGDGVKALELFERMELEGVDPNDVTYLGVLSACNHGGLVEEGLRMFNAMESHGVKPNVKHYGSLVDLLGRAGRLGEAYDAINSMPMLPDMVLWQTLLGACRTHGNVEMAEMVSSKLADMGSNNCGNFVLLSNLYATRERWADVGRVREAMKRSDVKKVPGVSYIEEKGVTHMFYNGDRRHERWKDIHAKLDEITYRMKEFGYVAETEFVLHDIGEEDKENALCHHSEKLAVAFGLISTNEDLPIRVIKNLRICGDCHTVFKLVSKIYNREIIVRDNVRFHRFKDGACSCKEYW